MWRKQLPWNHGIRYSQNGLNISINAVSKCLTNYPPQFDFVFFKTSADMNTFESLNLIQITKQITINLGYITSLFLSNPKYQSFKINIILSTFKNFSTKQEVFSILQSNPEHRPYCSLTYIQSGIHWCH